MKSFFDRLGDAAEVLDSRALTYQLKASQEKGLKKIAFNAVVAANAAGLVAIAVPAVSIVAKRKAVKVITAKFKK